MKFFLAPMQGLTGYTVRNAFHHHFDYIDKYYTPFIPAAKRMNAKIKRDIDPVNNDGITLIPQAMSIVADEGIDLHRQLVPYGYDEINVNLGCPSGTVVSKKRGSGILAYPDMLDSFLDELYTKADFPVSIKTRVGFNDDELWPKLIEIYSKYPISELTVHPRVQKDFYKNHPNKDVFAEALKKSKNPICYNGYIFTKNDYEEFRKEFPTVDCIMLGRGLLKNPGLIREIKENKPLDKISLRAFHDELYAGYKEVLSGDKTILFKMKELWSFLGPIFTNHEKYVKKIKKCEKLYKYDEAVEKLFQEQELVS